MHVSLQITRLTALAAALLLALFAPAASATDSDCKKHSADTAHCTLSATHPGQKPNVTVTGNALPTSQTEGVAVVGTAANSNDPVQYDSPAQDAITLGGVDGTRIHNVAWGEAPTDAVNVEQMELNDQMVLAGVRKLHEAGQDYADAGDATTLRAANAYTDARVSAMLQPKLDEFRHDVWSRMEMTDQRINRIGALGTAMTQMAVNASNGSSHRGRLAVGVGYTEGKKAMSVGYGRRIGRSSFSLGAAFSGSESSLGAGMGFDL